MDWVSSLQPAVQPMDVCMACLFSVVPPVDLLNCRCSVEPERFVEACPEDAQSDSESSSSEECNSEVENDAADVAADVLSAPSGRKREPAKDASDRVVQPFKF